MFPYHNPRKRKLFEVGNTSTDPFGLGEVDAFHGRPIKSFTSLLLDGNDDDDDDDYDYDYDDQNLDISRKKCKGALDPYLMESGHKRNQNEDDGLWSTAIVQVAEKDAQIQKLLHELYNKRKELVASQLENIVLGKKTKMTVKKIKSLKKTLKEVLSRPGGVHEDDGESSFVGMQRHEAGWLSCKVCETRMANMIICPCKHLSVCRRCDVTITNCPICKVAKINSVEVCLP